MKRGIHAVCGKRCLHCGQLNLISAVLCAVYRRHLFGAFLNICFHKYCNFMDPFKSFPLRFGFVYFLTFLVLDPRQTKARHWLYPIKNLFLCKDTSNATKTVWLMLPAGHKRKTAWKPPNSILFLRTCAICTDSISNLRLTSPSTGFRYISPSPGQVKNTLIVEHFLLFRVFHLNHCLPYLQFIKLTYISFLYHCIWRQSLKYFFRFF